ncbi:hypothetical protein [Agrococcus sp. Marseille-Q4369]|uniref:hypothetical protein n=1 Tax=Agrococcus sp. Marseille-Q4369 TaxID=2810513 RepID=UPI001B8AAE85|nr:hypothetical protein [Agrococcus sp. Marseille-Q4369]QUW18901.1 hypothetical protein JSQ78_00505 [Agrococcus sp. Marseille-Q4369]
MADSYGPKGFPKYGPDSNAELWPKLQEVGEFAGAVGNRRVGTKADRAALSVSTTAAEQAWRGLEFYETDTGITYLCVAVSPAVSWVRTSARTILLRVDETAEWTIPTGSEGRRVGPITLTTPRHVVVSILSTWMSPGNSAAQIIPYLNGAKHTDGLRAAATTVHNNSRGNTPLSFKLVFEADLPAGKHDVGMWIVVPGTAAAHVSLNMYLDVQAD